jgi:hypothetical protein
VLGAALLPIVGGYWLVELRGDAKVERRSAALRSGLAGIVVIGLSYVPLLVHELGSGFGETRAALEFISSGGAGSQLSSWLRPLVVGVRTIAWPLAGLFVDALPLAVAAVVLVVGSAVWRGLVAGQPERSGARWLGAGLAWSVAVLSIGAASLTTVVRALPVDHYHAFVDPIVVVLAGLGLAAIYRAGVAGRVLAVVAVGGWLAWNVAIAPPAVHLDGGYPAARTAAERVLVSTGGRSTALLSLPDFKPAQAMRYPLTILGADLVPADASPPPGAWVVVLCDDRFREAIGAACGGPAEDAAVMGGALVDRFEAHPGRWVSVYAPTTIARGG